MDRPSDRLDEAIETRRLDLDLSLNDVATASKISPATLRAIRRGTSKPNALTKRRLEDTLQWEHGSIDELLSGGEPTPIGSETDDSDDGLSVSEKLDKALEELASLKEEVKELRDRNQAV